MDYEHTQKSPLGWILLFLGALSVIITWLLSDNITNILISAGVTIALVFVSLCFGTLTVRNEDPFLAVRFGPLPIFQTKIAYSAITEVEAARSDILDGWGIHWLPGRGLIYNLWGFHCIRIKLGKKTVRVGTNDVDSLVRFLGTKIQPSKERRAQQL